MKATIWSQEFFNLAAEVAGSHLSDGKFTALVNFADKYAQELRDLNNAYIRGLLEKAEKEIAELKLDKQDLIAGRAVMAAKISELQAAQPDGGEA